MKLKTRERIKGALLGAGIGLALALIGVGAARGQPAQTLSRTIEWNDLRQVRSAYEDAFGKLYAIPKSAEKQAAADQEGVEKFGEPVRYLGFSFERGPVWVGRMSKTLAEPVCKSLGMKVATVDEEKQVLVCDPPPPPPEKPRKFSPQWRFRMYGGATAPHAQIGIRNGRSVGPSKLGDGGA